MVEVAQEVADAVREHMEQVGAGLRDARLAAGLTQGEVGQLAGVSRQLVSRIEQGINGEFSAYAAVAAALQRRLKVVEETGAEGGSLDRIHSTRLF